MNIREILEMSRKVHYLSKIFQPQIVSPKNAKVVKVQEINSKSQKLLLENGLIRPTAPGCFALLPLAMRSLRKLERIIHEELALVNAQEMCLPTLTNAELWRRTGRLTEMHDELFKLKDRHGKEFVLSPTHEESISDILASVSPISHKNLPIILYQMTEKHRDEKRPQGGLLRSRQFHMMDAYSFHTSDSCCQVTYDSVCQSFVNIFERIGVPFKKVRADAGPMGGNTSHEWHYTSADVGSDVMVTCATCNDVVSAELRRDGNHCEKCGGVDVEKEMGIEVGHTFILGTKYSESLGARHVSQNSRDESIIAACYGLGLTRILPAALEVMSEKERLIWPKSLAPFSLCIIGSKEGSKEWNDSQSLVTKLCEELTSQCEDLSNDILVDDRSHLSIGKRVLEAIRVGYPYVIVAGKTAADNILEITDTATGNSEKINFNDLIDLFTSEKYVKVNKELL